MKLAEYALALLGGFLIGTAIWLIFAMLAVKAALAVTGL